MGSNFIHLIRTDSNEFFLVAVTQIGMGNTCKPMAVSFQCMTKFTTNKIKKKHWRREERDSDIHEGNYVCHARSLSHVWAFWPYGPHRSQPGSYVHGILLTKILEWVALFSSRESSLPRNQTGISCILSSILSGRFRKEDTNTYSKFFSSVASQVLWMCSSLGTIVWALDVRGRLQKSTHIFTKLLDLAWWSSHVFVIFSFWSGILVIRFA